MSTIEQAAERLAQLRQAGIDTPGLAPVDVADGSAALAEPLPVRAVNELSRGQAPFLSDAREAAPVTAALVDSPALRRVDIDFARLSASGYITPHAPRSRLAEEFRVVKRPLLMNARGKSTSPVLFANRIMVTSSLPSEGKTFVSVNLAMSIAMELDTHVLLVDADAARPAVLGRLGLPPSKGLLDLLVEPGLDPSEVVLATNVERLSILPAGTQQERATELLASESMSKLIERLASDNPTRIVLVDSPPLLASTESRVLAAHMGQVILVIEADRTPQNTVAEALAAVENCPVVMTLLNKAPTNESGSYYGSYGT